MPNSDPLQNLLPSLVQCFGVIFIGYLSVRLNQITPQASAIGTYVTKFALPALFFRSMATINFTDVSWLFISGIAISKLILFVITFVCTIIITRPMNFGKAGIFSMFVTQSNDVALGYPILLSIYPDFAQYIYLFAPAQLIIINPLCFVLLELQEYRSTISTENNTNVSSQRRILLVLKNVLCNPLIFMTIVGVIFNLLLSHHLPVVVDKILQIFADSFAGVALFYLGMNMVGKISSVSKKDIYLLVFLLLGKLIFLPFLTREVVVHLMNINGPSIHSLNYSLVAFLYGGLPTAPPVFLVANSFQIVPDLIATGLVLVTFISGPLMFITTRVITMIVVSKSEFDGILKSTSVGISILSIVSVIWVLLLFLLSRRCLNAVHKITITYSVFVLLTCTGAVVGRIFSVDSTNQTDFDQDPNFGHYFLFSFYFVGCVGARLWTVLVAASLMFVKRNGIYSLAMNIKYFYIVGITIPPAITVLLVIFSKKVAIVAIDPSFLYGKPQLITSLLIFTICLPSTIVFIILEARTKTTENSQSNISTERLIQTEPSSINNSPISEPFNDLNPSFLRDHTDDTVENNEENESVSLLNSEVITNIDQLQIQRHSVLVLILVVTMSFSLFLCLWRLIKEELSGIYIELEFLDCVFNYGQGFILWMIFGLDTELIVIPFKKRICALLYSNDEFCIPPESNLSEDAIKTRNQFIKYHLENCRKCIVKDTRCMFRLYSDVFSGKRIIDWIIEIGLANNRAGAIGYGQVLLISGVIEHIKKNRNLIDDNDFLYRFTESMNNIDLSPDDDNGITKY